MKSFLEGRTVLAREAIPTERAGSQLPRFGPSSVSPGAPVHVSHAAPVKREHAEKTIEAVEVDGVVEKIIVTCACGERIEVFCGY